jgi:hypothetical protein
VLERILEPSANVLAFVRAHAAGAGGRCANFVPALRRTNRARFWPMLGT